MNFKGYDWSLGTIYALIIICHSQNLYILNNITQWVLLKKERVHKLFMTLTWIIFFFFFLNLGVG